MFKYIKLFLLILVFLPFYAAGSELQTYYVQKINESENKVTVKDMYGRYYLLTYSSECSGWWQYAGQRIYINARGQFLDGVGDEIYLNNLGNRACHIWKVTTVKGGPGYYVIRTASLCPDRGFISPSDPNMCECSSGYKFDPDRNLCLPFKSNDQICREKFGLYSIWDGTLDPQKALNCICKEGFIWNQNKTACIRNTNITVSNTGGVVAKTETLTTNETPDTAVADGSGNAENAQTETTVTNNTQNNTSNNTQRTPWYKTFWGFIIILVAITLVVYSFVKSYKKRQ